MAESNGAIFVNAVSQDLQKSRISNFMRKECIVHYLVQSTCTLNLKQSFFFNKINNKK